MRSWLFGLASGMWLCAAALATIWLLIRQDHSPDATLMLHLALLIAVTSITPLFLALFHWDWPRHQEGVQAPHQP
jgi:ABC-type nickel/cobalt efflux system permease component RcnA